MSASIFNGTAVKILKNILRFKDGSEISSTTAGNLVTNASTSTDNAVARYDSTTGKIIQNSGVTIDDSDNVIIPGDLTVNGTTTTVNSATLDVTDANITVNNTGNDASSEGAGLTVERTGTDGSLVYEDALTSKFKLGPVGSEVEVANISSAQTLTNKTIDADSNTLSNIDNNEIKASANISLDKLAAVTVTRALTSDASGFITASAVTSTELAFVSGVTSALQTQLDAKIDDFASTTDNALVRSNGTAGDAVQDSSVLLSDIDQMTGLAGLTFTTGVQVTSILDEDTLVSDSVTALATQQSIKAYVDTEVTAGKFFSVNSISTNTNAVVDGTYLVNTGATVQVTLPTPALNAYITVKDSTGTANSNNITIARNASENIDGTGASYTMSSNFEAKTFVSDGTNWFVL